MSDILPALACDPANRLPRGFDAAAVRADFPALNQAVRGRPLVYLDNAATTQKPACVIRAVCDYYGTCNANVHRALHHLGERATRRYEEVRGLVARFIGAASPSTIVFTRGTTEGINLVAQGWGRRRLKAGDEILLTQMEHHSNLVPWQMVARETGARLRFIPVTPDGELDLAAAPGRLTERTKILALTHVSNVLGTVNPVADLAAAAHAVGARVLVDAAQSVPHRPVDVAALGADFLAFSGHKMCGPMGIGVLYGRPDALEETDPLLGGGEMISRVEWESAAWAEVPQRFEAGTPNVSGVFGLGAAIEYIEALGREAAMRHEAALTARALEALGRVPGVTVHGRAPERGPIVSFELAGVHPHDAAQFLDASGIAIRAGHLCAQPLLRARGVPALNRASFCFYNTAAEVDALAAALEEARTYFGRGAGRA